MKRNSARMRAMLVALILCVCAWGLAPGAARADATGDLEAFLTGAASGDSFLLTGDAALSGTVPAGVRVDLNGHALTVNTGASSLGSIVGSGRLYLYGAVGGTIGGGVTVRVYHAGLSALAATLTQVSYADGTTDTGMVYNNGVWLNGSAAGTAQTFTGYTDNGVHYVDDGTGSFHAQYAVSYVDRGQALTGLTPDCYLAGADTALPTEQALQAAGITNQGYTFVGWLLNGTAITAIPAQSGLTGDVTLTAIWTESSGNRGGIGGSFGGGGGGSMGGLESGSADASDAAEAVAAPAAAEAATNVTDTASMRTVRGTSSVKTTITDRGSGADGMVSLETYMQSKRKGAAGWILGGLALAGLLGAGIWYLRRQSRSRQQALYAKLHIDQ